jgi:predicted MFS family arabinose efflux permease
MDQAARRFSSGDIWFIIVLFMIYMFNFIDRTIIGVLGESIRRELGLSDLQLGIMGGFAFALFYGALSIPLARLAERTNRLKLIAVVTAIWSVMTVLCGAAANFWQLLLFRLGVGVGEAGFTPSLTSLVADRFEPSRRATAFTLICVSVPVGSALAALGGGLLAQHFGWRLTFLIVGAPGILLALLLVFTVREPERTGAQAAADTPSFGAVLKRVGKSSAFLNLTAATGFVGLVGFGLNLFLIPLLVRRYGLPLPQAGLIFALSFSLATVTGTTIGALIADRFFIKNVKLYGLAPAWMMCGTMPFYWAAILQDDWRALVGLLFVATTMMYAFQPTIMTVTQRLVEPRMRATAAALHGFGQAVGGLAIGSVILGYLSDKLASNAFGPDYQKVCLGVKKGVAPVPECLSASASGLQHAMLAIGFFLIISVVCFYFAARSLPREIEASERALGGQKIDPVLHA